MASEEWEMKQDSALLAQVGNAAALGGRNWPLMSAARQTLEQECFATSSKISASLEVGCHSEGHVTLEIQTMLCKQLSRQGCCAYQLGAAIGAQFPFKLFLLLDDLGLEAGLLASCRPSRG
eukprot:301777-Pyramimonas_sp.AAC.1